MFHKGVPVDPAAHTSVSSARKFFSLLYSLRWHVASFLSRFGFVYNSLMGMLQISCRSGFITDAVRRLDSRKHIVSQRCSSRSSSTHEFASAQLSKFASCLLVIIYLHTHQQFNVILTSFLFNFGLCSQTAISKIHTRKV